MNQRGVDWTIGFLLSLVAIVFVLHISDYQASHCKLQVDATSDKQTVAQSGDQKLGKHQKAERSLACGFLGFPAAVVAFMDDHEGFFVGGFTFLLFVSTTMLWRSTNSLYQAGERQIAVAIKAANAAEASAEHIPRVERAYLTGGGPVRTDAFGIRSFRIEVENHGKTPAYLCAFDVHFSTLKEVRDGPQEVFPMRLYDDRIKPGGHLKPLDWVPFTRRDANVIYGAFWYQDLLKREHIFRFILRVDDNDDTHVGVAGVDDSYTYWD